MPGTLSESGVSEFPQRGVCQICGCTQLRACVLENGHGVTSPCYWADETETLCTNPVCLNAYWHGIEW